MTHTVTSPFLPWSLPLAHLRITSADADLTRLALAAMTQWLNLLNGPTKCQQGPGLIHVVWGRPLTPHCVGWTQPSWLVVGQHKRLQAITLTVVKSPAIDRQLTPDQQADRLAATLLHEMGHALGLDHLPQPDAVMHSQGWRNTVLSSWDAALLKQKYLRAAKP